MRFALVFPVVTFSPILKRQCHRPGSTCKRVNSMPLRFMILTSSGAASWWGNYFLRRDAPAIHPRQAFDFIGSSRAFAAFMACRSYWHPSQPGNSKAQNSPCDPLAVPSADGVSNRHLNGTRVSWFMTHVRASGGSATELSVTDKCQGQDGDGDILLQPVSYSVINIAHSPD